MAHFFFYVLHGTLIFLELFLYETFEIYLNPSDFTTEKSDIVKSGELKTALLKTISREARGVRVITRLKRKRSGINDKLCSVVSNLIESQRAQNCTF